jgi:hypothetical protein
VLKGSANDHKEVAGQHRADMIAKSRPRGRPRIPVELQRLIAEMTTANCTTTEWTIRQFRNSFPLDSTYRFLVHDRDRIFAPVVDDALRSMSLQVLCTPVRAPQANAHCERFIGTARRRVPRLGDSAQ